MQELEEQGLLAKGQNETNSTLRQADVNRRWTTRVNGVVQVPYAFAGQHDANAVAVIENAIKELGDRSRVVKFVPRSSEGDYIIIVDGSGCSSYVGRQGGEQPVTLAVWGCVTHGIVQHEFLHALGFNHEQSRPDRDEFVRINFENIDPSLAYNFDKLLDTDSLESPYDYGSVMHYGKADFSTNGGDTITAPQAIGQRDGADDADIDQVILLYQCVSGARSLDQFLASPCNRDCPCWEGASGCNGDSTACLAGLECNANNECAQPGVIAPVVAPVGEVAPVISPVGVAPVVAPVGVVAPVVSPVGIAPVVAPVGEVAPAVSPVGVAPVVAPVDVDSPVVSPVAVAPVVAPVGGAPVGGWPVGGAPVDGWPVDGAPVGGWPVGGAPVGRWPAGNAPFVSPTAGYDGWSTSQRDVGNWCGNGSVGNKRCFNPELCCSSRGWCGMGPAFCG